MTRSRLLVQELALLAAILLSVTALRPLIASPWSHSVPLLVSLVAVPLIGARLAVTGRGARWSPVPTLLALAAGGWVLHYWFGTVEPPRRAASAGAVEQLSGWRNLWALVESGGETIAREAVPVSGSADLVLLVVAGTILMLIVAETFLDIGKPALAIIPVLALWTPALAFGRAVPLMAFAGTGGAVLMLLAAGDRAPRPRTAEQRSRNAAHPAPVRDRTQRGLRAAVAVVGAGALVLTLSAGARALVRDDLGSRTFFQLFAVGQRGSSYRITDDLDLHRSIGRRSTEVLFRYQVSDGQGTVLGGQHLGPLRLATFADFDGRNWTRPPQPAEGTVPVHNMMLLYDYAPTTIEREFLQLRLTVEALRDDRLPLPTEPRAANGEWAGWWYDHTHDEVFAGEDLEPEPLGPGDVFSFWVIPRGDEEGIAAAQLQLSEYFTFIDQALPGSQFRELPSTDHLEQVAERARLVVGDAGTGYEKALALQNYLRDPNRFTYETVAPRAYSGDAVWDFLEQRTGFCVQFATAMAVMARTLDIPSRLAVGFLPGTQSESGTWEVTGLDAHAWPELFFHGVGWVRFEPTPGSVSGPAPAYATTAGSTEEQTYAPGNPVQDALPLLPAGSSGTQPEPTEAPTTGGAPAAPNGTPDAHLPWPLLAGAAALGLGILGWVRWRSRALRPEQAWTVALRHLSWRGVPVPEAMTPRQVPGFLEQNWPRSKSTVPTPVLAALATLATAVEGARYQPTPPAADPDELRAALARIRRLSPVPRVRSNRN